MTMTGNGTDSIGNDNFRVNTKDYIIAFDASPKCVLDELMAFKLLYLRFIIFTICYSHYCYYTYHNYYGNYR